VALNDAERSKLAEIEHELRQDARMMHVFDSTPVAPLRRQVTVTVCCAMAVFAAALVMLALLTRDLLPILLASIVVSVAAVWLWCPDRLRGRFASSPARPAAPGGDKN
jgi:Protein of unknown function (DUF3040)